MDFKDYTQEKKDKYIAEAKKLCDILEGKGLTPHLGFGSLLGAVRTGKLIDSDYDIDICYLSKFDNPEDIIIECQELYKELIEKGILIKYWDIDYNPITSVTKEIPKTFGQAHIKIGEFTIDLFTTWLDEKNNYNTCQWGNLGKFTTFELSTIENQSFSIPENYDEILTNLYGNWRVPTKEHPSKNLKRKSYLKTMI